MIFILETYADFIRFVIISASIMILFGVTFFSILMNLVLDVNFSLNFKKILLIDKHRFF